MPLPYRFMSTLVVVLVLLVSAIQPLAAAPQQQADERQTYGIVCADGGCSLRAYDAGLQVPQAVALGSSFLLQALQDHIHLLPDGTGLQITDDIVINTPAGMLDLLDTDLTLEVTPDHTLERMRGTARIPWPNWLGTDAANGTLAAAAIGLERGRDLDYLNVALAPERHYFYIRMGAGLQVDATGAIVQEQLHAFDETIPRGQYLTMLIDPTDSALLLDGNVRLSLLEAWMTFDDFLQEQTGIPFELANEAINVHLSGRVSPDVDSSFLQIDGLYTLERRFVRSWLQTDASPLAVNGSLRLSREGILLSGLTHSSIFPERLFNGEARLEAFLPLDGNLWDAYIAAGGYADLPSLAWQHGGEERLTLSTLQPHIATLLAQSAHIAERTQPFFVVVTDTANDAVVHAVRGLQVAGATVGDGYAWAVDTVIDGVVDGTTGTVAAAKAGFHSARGLATASYQWSATLVTNGAAATADAGYNSYVWTITRLDNSATAVSDAALSGYQATQAFAVGSYVWTVERSSAGAATVGTWTEGGYRVMADGVAAGLEVVGEWFWPPAWWGK